MVSDIDAARSPGFQRRDRHRDRSAGLYSRAGRVERPDRRARRRHIPVTRMAHAVDILRRDHAADVNRDTVRHVQAQQIHAPHFGGRIFEWRAVHVIIERLSSPSIRYEMFPPVDTSAGFELCAFASSAAIALASASVASHDVGTVITSPVGNTAVAPDGMGTYATNGTRPGRLRMDTFEAGTVNVGSAPLLSSASLSLGKRLNVQFPSASAAGITGLPAGRKPRLEWVVRIGRGRAASERRAAIQVGVCQGSHLWAEA